MLNPPKGYGEERYVVVIRKFAEVDGWCDHAEMPKAPAEFLGPVSHDSGDGRESAVRDESSLRKEGYRVRRLGRRGLKRACEAWEGMLLVSSTQ